MEELSLHILDIVENSIRAGADEVEIRINEDEVTDLLEIGIRDNGTGMDQATLDKVLDPFFTTKSVRKVGLGLSLFREAAHSAGGDMQLQSDPGKGTCVKAVFQHSHIDRQPLGDIAETLRVLMATNPEVRFQYLHEKNGQKYYFDSEHLGTESKVLPVELPPDFSR